MAIKVLQCFKNAKGNAYIGGVSTMLNSYFQNSDEFIKHDCEIEPFDFQPIREYRNSKIANVSYIFAQRKALSKRLKAESDVIINIHTSRDFLFLKDVFLAAMVNKKHSVPVVLTVHVGDIDTVFHRTERFKNKCVKLINKYVSRVVCLSNHIKEQFICAGIIPEKCVVLGNFHCLAPIDENVRIERASKLQLLFVGAIHREKGIIELLDALINLHELDVSLDICGKITDSTISEAFENKVKQLGDRVRVHGYVVGEKKSALYECADVLVLPSYHEGFPLVITEALAFGCGIISTRVGATSEILSESDNVIWAEIADVNSLEASIKKLYDDEKLLIEMKSKNKDLGLSYGINEHIKKLCLIYKEVDNVKKREKNG